MEPPGVSLMERPTCSVPSPRALYRHEVCPAGRSDQPGA